MYLWSNKQLNKIKKEDIVKSTKEAYWVHYPTFKQEACKFMEIPFIENDMELFEKVNKYCKENCLANPCRSKCPLWYFNWQLVKNQGFLEEGGGQNDKF